MDSVFIMKLNIHLATGNEKRAQSVIENDFLI